MSDEIRPRGILKDFGYYREKGSYPIIGSKERVESTEIKRYISQKVTSQNAMGTWWDKEVELNDGRIVTIRDVQIEGIDR